MKLDELYPKLEKALQLAGTHSAEDLADAIQTGAAKLWINRDAIVVTEIEEYPKAKHLRVWIGAGLLDDVLGLWPEIEAHAEQEGCDRVVCLGRKGWRKPLEKLGWIQSMCQYEKVVN